jgi:hypothetical protein
MWRIFAPVHGVEDWKRLLAASDNHWRKASHNVTIGGLRHQRRATTALVIAATALSLLANGCASLVRRRS